MRRAIALARRGEGHTMPNPPVGAVVLAHGRIQGEGYHSRAGGAHAEILALKSAGLSAKGSCLYVTLEPCCTTGRTGPCTKAIIKSGVKRVVIAARDPNPVHKGKGIRILKKAGIHVDEGVCSEESGILIKPFAKWITSGKPFLTLKLGMSIDGRIADRHGRSKWITSETSRAAVRTLRCSVDAILVGAGTAAHDNPSLLCSGSLKPFRIVVDSSGRLSTKSQLLDDRFANRTILATTQSCPVSRIREYSEKGAMVFILPSSSSGHVSLKALMTRLGKMGILHVLCEGGGTIANSLVSQDLVDEYLFFVAPIIMGGGDSVACVAGEGWPLASCPKLKFIGYGSSGDDIVLRAVPAGKKRT